MRISDWSSDVCSSDLQILKCFRNSRKGGVNLRNARDLGKCRHLRDHLTVIHGTEGILHLKLRRHQREEAGLVQRRRSGAYRRLRRGEAGNRSEAHQSELQSLMCTSYAAFSVQKARK